MCYILLTPRLPYKHSHLCFTTWMKWEMWSLCVKQRQSFPLVVFHRTCIQTQELQIASKYVLILLKHNNLEGTHYFSSLVFRNQNNTCFFYLLSSAQLWCWATLETQVTITALWRRPKDIPLHTCRVLPNQGTSASLAGFCGVQTLVQNCSSVSHVDSSSGAFSAGSNDKTQDHQCQATTIDKSNSYHQWDYYTVQCAGSQGTRELSFYTVFHFYFVTHREAIPSVDKINDISATELLNINVALWAGQLHTHLLSAANVAQYFVNIIKLWYCL